MDGLYGYISGIGCFFCFYFWDVDFFGMVFDVYDG